MLVFNERTGLFEESNNVTPNHTNKEDVHQVINGEENARRDCLRKEIEKLPVYSVKNGVVEGGNLYYRGEIHINNNPTRIKATAFCDYKELTKIYLPPTISEIGSHAFSGCSNLVAVIGVADLANPIKRDIEKGLIKTIIFPDLVSEIEDGTFFGCCGFDNIIIPPSIKSIGEDAFCLCKNIVSLVISNSVSYIGKEAFKYCNKLKFVFVGKRNYEFIKKDLPVGVNVRIIPE